MGAQKNAFFAHKKFIVNTREYAKRRQARQNDFERQTCNYKLLKAEKRACKSSANNQGGVSVLFESAVLGGVCVVLADDEDELAPVRGSKKTWP